MALFQSDHEDYYPNVQSDKAVIALMSPYVPNMKVASSANPKGSQIRFNFKLAGHNLAQLKDMSRTIMFYESDPWSDGRRCVVYADSHAKQIQAAEWSASQDLMNNPVKDSKATKPFSPAYQASLENLYDRLMRDKYGKPTLTETDLKLVNPDFATGEPAKVALKP